MPTLNKIEPSHIERLGPEELVRLLYILLHAEARARCLDEHGIHVPFQITVADGGRDGKWEADIKSTEYIPKNLTFYQCKATNLTESDCRDEVLRTDNQKEGITLKEKVQQVLAAGGSYVIFCSHPIVKIDERIEACRKALSDAGRNESATDSIAFLDANKIATWTNLHVAAFAFVNRVTNNFQEVSLRNVEQWGNDAMFSNEFQTNDYLDAQIVCLRNWLAAPRKVARITGASGLGKTRLGFEVFSGRSVGNKSFELTLKESTVYFDFQSYDMQIIGCVEQLYAFAYSGIIVADNCPISAHFQLAQIVTRRDSKLSLLTMDYVPEASNPGILHISLDPHKQRDVVPKILKNDPDLSHLEESAIQRISAFAQGFPQIAILTAKAGRALGLEDLNSQNKLAEKLLWGRDAPDTTARKYLRCLAIFSSVGANGSLKSQLDFVRKYLCNEVAEYDFNISIGQFKRKRIIQEAGNYVMVTPTPLAVALAAEWLEDVPPDFLWRRKFFSVKSFSMAN